MLQQYDDSLILVWWIRVDVSFFDFSLFSTKWSPKSQSHKIGKNGYFWRDSWESALKKLKLAAFAIRPSTIYIFNGGGVCWCCCLKKNKEQRTKY
jgi:hypothetical protein